MRSKSDGQGTLEAIEAERTALVVYPEETRELSDRAARVSINGWFKSVSAYQLLHRALRVPRRINGCVIEVRGPAQRSVCTWCFEPVYQMDPRPHEYPVPLPGDWRP